MESLTTGRLAKEAGVKIDTVRFYEKRGLIPKPPRRDSGYRMFGEDAVKRIIFMAQVLIEWVINLLEVQLHPLWT